MIDTLLPASAEYPTDMTSSDGPVRYPGLDGKTALVTGSSRNIGRAVAVALGESGANVGVTAKSDREGCERTADAVAAAGGETAVALGDLGDPDDVAGVVEAVRDELGPIDVLVNNAAIRPTAPFEDITIEQWQHVQDANLRSAFLLSQAAYEDMRARGSGAIVNVLGLMALQGRRTKAHAAVTKTGLIGLTRTLAAELGPNGVRINSVVPGRKVKTERDSVTEADRKNFRKIEEATPLRRRADPEEIASVVRFVASEEASFVTGEVIKVDGGLNTCIDIENVSR